MSDPVLPNTQGYPESPPETPLSPGAVVAGRYRIDALLGVGGMGRVYRATHLALRYPVALKVLLLPADRLSAADRERFRQEARIAISLDHPNVVRVLDYGADGPDYLVMEWIDGSNAQRLLREGGPFPLSRLLRVGEDVLGGLACLHERGIIHRDVKPANVLIRRQDTRVKLADFGLALDLQTTQQQGGTPLYMAPEVLDGCAASTASDVFAIGVTLLELLTGTVPWRGPSLGALRESMKAALPKLPSLVQSHAPAGVVRFLTTCLAPDRQHRFHDSIEAAKAFAGVEPELQAVCPKGPLVRNRVAVLSAEPSFAEVLSAALGASGLLSVVALNGLTDPDLPGLVGQLDAVLIDPSCAAPEAVEEFVGQVRRTHPQVVFFLLMPRGQQSELVGRFSPLWQRRFDHYFATYTDRPVRDLPAMVREVARGILFDRSTGGQPQTALAPD